MSREGIALAMVVCLPYLIVRTAFLLMLLMRAEDRMVAVMLAPFVTAGLAMLCIQACLTARRLIRGEIGGDGLDPFEVGFVASVLAIAGFGVGLLHATQR